MRGSHVLRLHPGSTLILDIKRETRGRAAPCVVATAVTLVFQGVTLNLLPWEAEGLADALREAADFVKRNGGDPGPGPGERLLSE